VTVADIAAALRTALGGSDVGTLAVEREAKALLASTCALPPEERVGSGGPRGIQLATGRGGLVPLAELGRWERASPSKTIYHKNLQRVAYVFAEAAGRPPADAVRRHHGRPGATVRAGERKRPVRGLGERGRAAAAAERTHLTAAVAAVVGRRRVPHRMGGRGRVEDHARRLPRPRHSPSAAAFGSSTCCSSQPDQGATSIPLVVMLSIPFTMVGILPGFWLLNVLLGAESRGVRHAGVLHRDRDDRHDRALGHRHPRSRSSSSTSSRAPRRQGLSLDAVIEAAPCACGRSCVVRAAAILASIPITLDPIFSGLAWALIFGLAASTAFTRSSRGTDSPLGSRIASRCCRGSEPPCRHKRHRPRSGCGCRCRCWRLASA
jgi:hypothetical protein